MIETQRHRVTESEDRERERRMRAIDRKWINKLNKIRKLVILSAKIKYK